MVITTVGFGRDRQGGGTVQETEAPATPFANEVTKSTIPRPFVLQLFSYSSECLPNLRVLNP